MRKRDAAAISEVGCEDVGCDARLHLKPVLKDFSRRTFSATYSWLDLHIPDSPYEGGEVWLFA